MKGTKSASLVHKPGKKVGLQSSNQCNFLNFTVKKLKIG